MRKRNKLKETWPGTLTMEQEAKLLFDDNQNNLKDYEEGEFVILTGALIESSDIDTGEVQEVLVLENEDGSLWATISPTFIDSYMTISAWLSSKGMRMVSFTIETGKSKKNREFLTCKMGRTEDMPNA